MTSFVRLQSCVSEPGDQQRPTSSTHESSCERSSNQESPEKMNAKYRKTGDVPARFVLVILGFCGCFLIHANRVNLSVAIVAMVDNPLKEENYSEAQCINPAKLKLTNLTVLRTPELAGEDYHPAQFEWSHQTQALLLSAYFYGYVATQLAGGRLAEIVGVKWLYAVGILGTSILALLTPFAAGVHPGLFMAVRVGQGMLSGASFPLLHILLARWVPAAERSFLSTLAYGGLSLGNMGGFFLTGIICQSHVLGGWPVAYYLFGTVGVAWSFAWLYFVYDSPVIHPRISSRELEHIVGETTAENGANQPPTPIPWRYIFTSGPIWALLLAHVGHSWGQDTLLLELPTYMNDVMGVDIGRNGVLSALPFLMQALCGCSAAFIVDKLVQKGKIRVGVARKTCNCIAFFGAATCFLAVPAIGCHETGVIVLLCAAMGFDGISRAGFFVNHMDLAPEYAGTLMGLTSSVGSIDGFLVPSVVSLLTEGQPNMYHWAGVFGIAAGIYIFAGIFFFFLGSGDKQPWAKSPSATKPLLLTDVPIRKY